MMRYSWCPRKKDNVNESTITLLRLLILAELLILWSSTCESSFRWILNPPHDRQKSYHRTERKKRIQISHKNSHPIKHQKGNLQEEQLTKIKHHEPFPRIDNTPYCSFLLSFGICQLSSSKIIARRSAE